MRVERQIALCCIQGGGTIAGCSCINPDHGAAYFDVRRPLPGDKVMAASPTSAGDAGALRDMVSWMRERSLSFRTPGAGLACQAAYRAWRDAADELEKRIAASPPPDAMPPTDAEWVAATLKPSLKRLAEIEALRLAYKTGHSEGYTDATDDGTGNGYSNRDAAEEGWQQYRDKLTSPSPDASSTVVYHETPPHDTQADLCSTGERQGNADDVVEPEKYADMGKHERAVAMADDCVGNPWELLGYFREKLAQSEWEADHARSAAIDLAQKLVASRRSPAPDGLAPSHDEGEGV